MQVFESFYVMSVSILSMFMTMKAVYLNSLNILTKVKPFEWYFHFTVAADNGIGVEVALQWNDSYQENVRCFTNNIPQKMVVHTLQVSVQHYPWFKQLHGKWKFIEKRKSCCLGDDAREGLTAIISVKVPGTQNSLHKPKKTGFEEVKPAVEQAMNKEFSAYLLENPQAAKSIAGKIIDAARAWCSA